MEQLNSHFNNLVGASTNSHTALDHLVASTTEQYANIKAALYNLAAAAPSKPALGSMPKNTNPLSPTKNLVIEKRILILQSAVKN